MDSGQAHFSNNDLDKAESDFRKVGTSRLNGPDSGNVTTVFAKVLAVEPNHGESRQELHKIKERRKELERKSIKELSGMFNRGKLS